MSKIRIIASDLTKLPEIVTLNYQIFKGMYEHEPYSLGDYQDKLSDVKPIIYIAQDGENIIGDSVAFERDGYFYIWILGVSKEYRGQGIGERLIEENEKKAKNIGFKEIQVKVYDISELMKSLLDKKGYKVIKKEKNINYFIKRI